MKKMNLLVIGCLSLIGCSATLSVFALTDAPTDPISVNLENPAFESLKDMMSKEGPMYPIGQGEPIRLPRTESESEYKDVKIPFKAGITDGIPLGVFKQESGKLTQNFISYWGVGPLNNPREVTIAPTGSCASQIGDLKSGDTLQITQFYAPLTRGDYGEYDCSIA